MAESRPQDLSIKFMTHGSIQRSNLTVKSATSGAFLATRSINRVIDTWLALIHQILSSDLWHLATSQPPIFSFRFTTGGIPSAVIFMTRGSVLVVMWPSDFLLVAECQWPNLSPRLVTRGDIYELDLRHVAPCQRPNLALWLVTCGGFLDARSGNGLSTLHRLSNTNLV